MEELNKVENLIGHIKEYAETRFDLVALNLQDKGAEVLSSIVSSIIGTVLTLFVILFSSLGVALWLGNYFKNSFIGFFCIAVFYLVVALVVIVNRQKWIKTPIINSLIKKVNFHEEN
jgi:uncharacterized membrane protein YqjE